MLGAGARVLGAYYTAFFSALRLVKRPVGTTLATDLRLAKTSDYRTVINNTINYSKLTLHGGSRAYGSYYYVVE